MSNEQGPKDNIENGAEFSKAELADLQESQQDRLNERAAETKTDKHESEQKARHEIEKAVAEKETVKAETSAEKSTAETRPANTKTARKKAYDKIMDQTQKELPPASRAFSKVIHNPVIEKVSEVAGKTIARPNAILSGSILAFIFTLAIYVIAKFNGYPLSGTEAIAAFILGWVVGNLYDFFKTMITGKR